MRLCVACAAGLDVTGWSCPRCGLAPSVVDGVPVLAPEIAYGNPGDAEYRYRELYEIERHHFWFVSRCRLIAWAIRRYFPDARSLLDVGCGTGGVLTALRRLLPDLQLSATDALLSGLAFARRQLPGITLVQADLRRLPYDREFDVVGVFDVLEHLDDDELALGEIFRSIKPGGGLMATVPQHQFLWSALDEYSRHRRRYGGDLVDKVSRAGFVVRRATSFMTATLPLQFASRLRQPDISRLDPTAEMRLHPIVNGLLRAICAAERAVIVSGVSLPLGGSLLVVAARSSVPRS
jgi:ubiquinone/menaquinone biosynthesis C-methylase UbiE